MCNLQVKKEETKVDVDGSTVTVLNVSCRFQCAETGSDSQRDMVYHVSEGLITEIHHL